VAVDSAFLVGMMKLQKLPRNKTKIHNNAMMNRKSPSLVYDWCLKSQLEK
jgi:hypothetical protein